MFQWDIADTEPHVRIILNETKERRLVDTKLWQADDYRQQWHRSVKRLLTGEDYGVFVTDFGTIHPGRYWFECWPAWRQGDELLLENQFVTWPIYKRPWRYDVDPAGPAPLYRAPNPAGRVSQWRIPAVPALAAMQASLRADPVATLVGLPPRGGTVQAHPPSRPRNGSQAPLPPMFRWDPAYRLTADLDPMPAVIINVAASETVYFPSTHFWRGEDYRRQWHGSLERLSAGERFAFFISDLQEGPRRRDQRLVGWATWLIGSELTIEFASTPSPWRDAPWHGTLDPLAPPPFHRDPEPPGLISQQWFLPAAPALAALRASLADLG